MAQIRTSDACHSPRILRSVCGTWGSVTAISEYLADETGLLNEAPEELHLVDLAFESANG